MTPRKASNSDENLIIKQNKGKTDYFLLKTLNGFIEGTFCTLLNESFSEHEF